MPHHRPTKMGSEKFCLRWNDFEKNISTAFRELRDDKDFFDVTLACDDRDQLPAHKVILSACSPFFRQILRRNPHQHPLLYLKGVKYTDLQSVLNFMYHGEVNVAQDELNSFLAVAEDLRVKGLTQNDQQSDSGGGGSSGGTGAQNSKSAVGSYSSPSSQLPKSPAPVKSAAARSSDHHRDLISAPPPAKRPRASLPSSSNSAVINAPPPRQPPSVSDNTNEEDDDDDDIKEVVVPVKSEPRDSSSGSGGGGVVANTADMYSTGGGGSQSQALAPEDDDMLYGQDESYDDYEQYGDGGGYGDGSGGMLDPSQLGGGGADGNKGPAAAAASFLPIRTMEDFDQFVVRESAVCVCALCGLFRNKTITNVRCHIESRHFPGTFQYACDLCGKMVNSRTSLRDHTAACRRAFATQH